MAETKTNQATRIAEKRLNAVIGHVTSVAISCGLLMWSVFNLWLNILAFRANEEPEQAWGITAGMVLVTCIVPFFIGMWLLFRTLGQKSDSQ